MNIGQGRFPLLTKEQTNPALSGLQDQIVRHLANKQQQLHNASMGLENQITKAQVPYASDMAKQKDLSAMLANHMQSMQNQYYPQEEQAKIDQLKANAQYMQSGGRLTGVVPQAQRAIDNEIKIKHPDWSQEKILDARNAYISGATTLPDGTKLDPASPSILLNADYANLRSQGTKAINQQRAAATLDKQIAIAEPLAQASFGYTGLGGDTDYQADAMKAYTGLGSVNPKYYQAYTFRNTTVPNMLSTILLAEGSNATDKQKALAASQVLTKGFGANPKAAQEAWDNLKSIYQGIGGTISTPNIQNTQMLQQKGQQAEASAQDEPQSFSDEIDYFVKKYGINKKEAQKLSSQGGG